MEGACRQLTKINIGTEKARLYGQQLDSQDQGFCVNVQNSCKTTEFTGNFIAWDLNLF